MRGEPRASAPLHEELAMLRALEREDNGNTWTGRGRMPRWMMAATKGGKSKKEDFLIA